jgi:hypothetical protein
MRLTPVLKAIVSLFTFAVVGIPAADCSEGVPIPEKDLARFLGPVPRDQLTWTVMPGPDFDVYYGKANPPLAGSVGFYLGFAPQNLEFGQTKLKSRLGHFPVEWHRSVGADGSIEQEAIIVVDRVGPVCAHVWASAPNQNHLNSLLPVLGKLPIFASGLLPGRFEETHYEMLKEERIRRISWAPWSVLLLGGAWVVDRFCRRRQLSGAARCLAFAGVIAFMIAVTIGGVLGSSNLGIHWFRIANMRPVFCTAGVLCVVALLLGVLLFLVRACRTRSRGQTLTVG